MTVPPSMNGGQSAHGSSNSPPGSAAAAASAASAAAPSVATAAASDSVVEVEEEDETEVEDGVAALRSAPIESASAGASSPRSRPARTSSRSGSSGSSPAVALPPADLNHADLDRIRAALPKTSKLADKIVAERDSNGAFRSFHDLKVRVRGLGAAKVKLLQQSGLTIELAQAVALQHNHAQQTQSHQSQAHIDSSLLYPAAVTPASPPDGAHAVSSSSTSAPSAASGILLPVILPAVVSVPMWSSTPPPPAAESMTSPVRPSPAATETSTTTASSSSCCWSSWICCSSNDSPAKVSAAPNASTATHTVQMELTSFTVASQPTTTITTPDDDLERQLANMSIGAPPAPVPPVPADSAIPPPSRSQPTLRVGSWNLCHFSTTKAHQRATLSVVADVLIRQRFDVMVLLEVRSDEACQMLLAELNNPHRQLPSTASQLQPCDDSGVGQWAYVLSDCVEYGSEAHALPSSSFSSPQQLVLEADIVEERFSADGTILSSSHMHSIAHARSGPALEGADDVLSSMASLSLREETHVMQNGFVVNSSSSSVSTAQVTTGNGFSTPAKKRPSRALSPPTNGQHRRGSTGNSSGSNGSGFTPRRSHKKKEYYCFFYRRDRVELPNGCRLFQSKAAPNSGSTSPAPPCVAADAHSWWRSPCYAVVRPLPNLLGEFAGASATPAPASSSSLPLSWMLVALHVIWGDGEADVLHECAALQHLYCNMAEQAAALAPADGSGECNCAVALVGDFNINASDADFTRHCLPATHYEPLILRPHATTFSSHRHACNLYDQCFIERRVLDALAPPSTSAAVSSSGNAAAAAIPAGVVYFDTTYFPPSDASDAACAARCRGEAKKWVSDHRPIFIDVPCVGDVRGVASRTPPVRLPPIPVQAAPKAAPAPSPISPPSSPPPASSDAADATLSADVADAVPLSALLSIIVVTSAIPVHPSTEVIDCVLHSFSLVPELRGVPIFIMADAPKLVLPDQAAVGATVDPNIFKRGVMTQTRFDNYRRYLQNLRARYASRPDIRIVELPVYSGFAWAVKEALESHVRTPFVLVCQHDYIFTMRVPIRELVLAMDHSHRADRGSAATAAAAAAAAAAAGSSSGDAPPGPINYVGFIHKRTQNYLHTMHRNMPADMRAHPLHRLFRAQTGVHSSDPPLLLCPLLFWYDKQHLASSRYYRDVVLTHPRLTGGPGRFVEDEFGVAQIEEVRAARDGTTMDQWAKFGSFLYYPDERGVHIALRHIHGRRFEQQRVGGLHRFLAPAAADDPHSDTDAGSDADARTFDAMFE